MKRIRRPTPAAVDYELDAPDGRAALHAVSAAAPAATRWSRLYGALAVVAVCGAGLRAVVEAPVLAAAVDAAFGLAVFGVLATWIRLNRVALSRGAEPEAGTGRPELRIVRSRPRPDDTGPYDNIVIPYDFR
jgi:hypothetical protein